MTENLLSKLIGPGQSDVFYQEHWERSFLLVEKFGIECSDIVSSLDIDFFLSQRALSYPFIRLVKNGKEIPLLDYLRRPFDQEFRLIDSDKVLSFYLDGATIILQKAHLWIDKLNRLTDDLQKDLRFPVNCNVYITPPQSKGFEPHFDTHDVFILQISGEKIWNLYDNPTPLPLETESLTKQQSREYLNQKPSQELTLKEGNLLYVPRGLVHDTFTLSKQSIHVTVGIFPPRGVDLLKLITTEASRRTILKQSLSQIGANDKSVEGFSNLLSAEFQGVLEKFSGIAIASHLQTNFLGVPVQDNSGRFQELMLLDALCDDTMIFRRQKIVFKIEKRANRVELSFYDKSIVFPDYTYESINFILNRTSFSVREIEGCLDRDAKIILAKKLIKEGFLSLACH